MQLILSTLCMALTSAVIGNAYYQKKQFYPSVVYITKSNASMAVIYIQFFVIVFMFGKLLRKIFLGTLRAAEFEHLLERFWYALTETCLAFTVFRDDFNPRFVALFTVLLFLKSFHWLAEERVDFMERSPVLGWLFHIRVASLLIILGFLDYLLLIHAYNSTMLRGPTVQLVFGFEYAILLTVVASTGIKYILHAAEMRTDAPWENKAVFLLYTELVIGLVKVILYVLFVVIMAKIYALPMFVFRPMFFTIRNFKKALSDVILSRRAIRNMNTLYPDATSEELRQSDNICIICREDMVNHSKKLPCGHIFHTTCLRSWFQRQQTCPTCRLNILRAPNGNSTAMPRPADDNAAAGAAVAGAPAPADGGTPVAPVQAPNAVAGGVAGEQQQQQPDLIMPGNLPFNVFENMAAAHANLAGRNSRLPNLSQLPPLPPMPLMMPPPFPFFAPYAVPPPPLPPDLTSFTDEQLLAMEGTERSAIEQRLTLLSNIQTMLDAVDILIDNYENARLRTHAPTIGSTGATRTPAAESISSNNTSSSSTTSSSSNNSLPATIAPISVDGPSTSSAAAAAAAAFAATLNAETAASAPNRTPTVAPAAAPLSSPLSTVEPTAATVSSSPPQPPPAAAAAAVATSVTTTTALINQGVIIEDLGAENDPTTTSAIPDSIVIDGVSNKDNNNINITIDNDQSGELSELRKRRLKNLEERNKSTSTTTATTITTTSKGD